MNPFKSYPVTQTWEEHLANGSLGGVDYAMGVGTPLKAPSSGTIKNIPDNGTGGHTVTLIRPDGTKTQYMHLSAFAMPGSVVTGQIIGLSGGKPGAPGAGKSDGPHVHAHDILSNGKRVPPFSTIAVTASLETLHIITEAKKRDDMTSVIVLSTAEHGDYRVEPGLVIGIDRPLANGIVWNDEKNDNWVGADVWPVADADIAGMVFALSGSPQLPAIGEAIMLVNGEWKVVTSGFYKTADKK